MALALPATMLTKAHADFVGLGPATQFAVLSQYSNNQTNFNNGTINGDIGLSSPRQFTISNASLNGNIRFSGAASFSGITGFSSPNPIPFGAHAVSGGGTFTGALSANDSVVAAALKAMNSYSQMLGGEAGTALGSLTSSMTILASNGILDANGNRVFNTTNVNLNNATVLTINGSASDYLVVNVNDSNPAFNGQIVLTGGITSDHVIFNMYGGNYTKHTGGPTLTISTNGQTTTGIFLDPNGGMQLNHSVLNGRFFGGDTTNQQIVSGAYINAPEGPMAPAPAGVVLAGLGFVTVGGLAAWRKRKTAAVC